MSGMRRAGVLLACTGALWVFPSFGTHGMGTLRQAYSHTDRQLFVDDGAAQRGETLLRSVDRRMDAIITNGR